MNCSEWEVRILALLDDRRPLWTDPEVCVHARSCQSCGSMFEDYLTLVKAVRRDRARTRRVLAELRQSTRRFAINRYTAPHRHQ